MGEKFRSRALKFPGLISGCTIDWFFRWPRDALIEVSEHFLNKFDVVSTPETKQELIYVMGEIQDYVALTCNSYFDKYIRKFHKKKETLRTFFLGSVEERTLPQKHLYLSWKPIKHCIQKN